MTRASPKHFWLPTHPPLVRGATRTKPLNIFLAKLTLDLAECFARIKHSSLMQEPGFKIQGLGSGLARCEDRSKNVAFEIKTGKGNVGVRGLPARVGVVLGQAWSVRGSILFRRRRRCL